jgi:lactate permease
MGLEGAAFGLFPIMWIVINAIWIYNMTVKTGHFAVLRRSLATISNDQRIQAVIIAFSFGALIEGLAGFGTPVAITAVMLIAVGFSPLKAAALALIGNTAPVAFGSIATPIVTLAAQTELPVEDLGAMVGRQTPFLALIVPLILVGVVDGGRGLRQTWPAAMVAGVSFAITQFVCSNYVSVELTDLVAALVSTVFLVSFLRFWKPTEPLLAEPAGGPRPAIAGASGHDAALERSILLRDQQQDSTREKLEAYAPYIIIVFVFALAKLVDLVEQFLFEISGGTGYGTAEKVGNGFAWPGLDIVGADGEAPSAQTFAFSFFDTPGTVVLFCGAAHDRCAAGQPPRRAAHLRRDAGPAEARDCHLDGRPRPRLRDEPHRNDEHARPLDRRIGRRVRLPVADHRLAGCGHHGLRHLLQRAGALQVEAAKEAGLSDVLLASANSSGGVLGKMISPQNLAIGAAAVGLAGKEGDIFRRVLFWSVAMTLAMCVIVYLQSTAILDWMVVGAK